MKKTLWSLFAGLLLGFSAGTVFLFGLAGFSLTALLGVSVLIPVGVALGFGLSAVLLRYLVPWLVRITLNNYLEKQIGTNPQLLAGQSPAKYLMNQSNKHMQDYIQSDRRNKASLFAAQDHLKTLVYLQGIKQNPLKAQGLKQRLLAWLLKSVNLLGSSNEDRLTEQDLELAGIQNDGQHSQTPVTKEKYSPEQLLKKSVLPQQKIPVAQEFPKPVKKSVVPDYLAPWQSRTVSLHQQIEKSQVNQVNRVKNNAIADKELLKQSLGQRVWVDDSKKHEKWKLWDLFKKANLTYTNLWFGQLNSAIEDFNNNQGQQQFLEKFNSKRNNNFKFYISEEAKNILLAGENSLRGHNTVFDLDLLPLGFFLERDNQNWVLKFNVDLRIWQLGNLGDIALRLDPAKFAFDSPKTILPVNGLYITAGKATKDEFLHTLKKLKLTLSKTQLKLIEAIDKSLFKESFEEEKKAQVFKALLLIAQESEQPNRILTLLDVLQGFDRLKLAYSKQEKTNQDFLLAFNSGAHSLLYFFLYYHLTTINHGKAFDSPRLMSYIKRLASLSKEELHWFGHLTEQSSMQSNTLCYYDLEEICEGLFYFVDFFKAQKLPLPTNRPNYNGARDWFQQPITTLKGYLDCIALAASYGDGMKQLQCRFFEEMPLEIAIAKAQLRAGYRFVHRAMCFDDPFVAKASTRTQFTAKFPHIANPFIISSQEFANTSYHIERQDDGIFYRALYLRFIALHVDSKYIEVAIKNWENMTKSRIDSCSNLWANTLEHLNRKERWVPESVVIDGESVRETTQDEVYDLNITVSTNWDLLKQYALSLPRKTARTVPYTPEGLVNEEIAVKALASKSHLAPEVDALLKKLDLEESLKRELSEEITQLNALVAIYDAMTPEALEIALANASTLSTLARLALVRETFARHSANKNNRLEWLRLEQLVSVLISLKKDALFQIETGEGKTLIIQIIALLKALDGKQVYVLTHNESLAEIASEQMQALASFLHLNVSNHKDSDEEIAASSIHYVDIANAVLAERMAQLNNNYVPTSKGRVALIDEVDNITIDVHATSTMQISDSGQNADAAFIAFLHSLNEIVRNGLVSQAYMENATRSDAFKHLADYDIALHRAIVQEALKSHPYYREDQLDFWIKAAISAMQFVEKEDYVIEYLDEAEMVRIVHKDTTGRVDKKSQWSLGVHPCVAAWEKQKGHPQMSIPGLAEVLAEGDIATYLQEHFESRCALTGTLGEEAVQEQIKEIIHPDLVVTIPRAKRELKPGIAWPKRDSRDCFNRSYRFPPIHTQGKQKHYEKLAEALCGAHRNGQSSLVFFNTITECDDFYNYLLETNPFTEHASQYLQILDDTHDPERETLRPSEEAIILCANQPLKITLTTAAGSRGTDFKSVDAAFIAKPGLTRVIDQKAGRVGRNGEFGLVYEIYNDEDLSLTALAEEPEPKNPFRYKLEAFEKAKQAGDLEAINTRKAIRQDNQALQQRFFALRRSIPVDKMEKLDKDWSTFFSQYGRQDCNLTFEGKSQQFDQVFSSEELHFADTVQLN
ncbi:MAG: DEAD/DEAH box helicase [Tatlockia sp.]|jgi:preprotein translocase subunit SecA